MVRGRALHGHEHEVRHAGASRRADQHAVAVAIDRLGARVAGPGEPVHRRDDDAAPSDRARRRPPDRARPR